MLKYSLKIIKLNNIYEIQEYYKMHALMHKSLLLQSNTSGAPCIPEGLFSGSWKKPTKPAKSGFGGWTFKYKNTSIFNGGHQCFLRICSASFIFRLLQSSSTELQLH